MFSEVRRNSVVTEIWINDRNQGLCPLLAVDHRDNFLLKSAEAIPTEKHILAWAKWVADAEWIRCGKFAHRPFGLQDGNPLAIAKVVARFRQLDFDSKSGTHSAEEIIIHNVEPGKEASKVAT